MDNHTRSRQQTLTDLHRQHALERPVKEEAQNLGRRKARVVSGREARPGTAHRAPRRRDQTYLWTSPARKKGRRDKSVRPQVQIARGRVRGGTHSNLTSLVVVAMVRTCGVLSVRAAAASGSEGKARGEGNGRGRGTRPSSLIAASVRESQRRSVGANARRRRRSGGANRTRERVAGAPGLAPSKW